MSFRLVIPWTEQPAPGTQLDVNHPVYPFISGAWLLGSNPTDLYGKQDGDLSTNGTGVDPVMQAGRKGRHLEFDGTGSIVALGSVDGASRLKASSGVLTVFLNHATGDASQRVFDITDGGGYANGVGMEIDDVGVSQRPYIQFQFRNNSATATALIVRLNSNPRWNRDGWNTLCFSAHDLDDTTGFPAGHINGCLNGTNLKDIASTIVSDTAANGTDTGTVNGRIGSWNHTTGREWNGGIALVVLLKGLLPFTLVRSLTENPWQIFEPRYVLEGEAVVGVGPVLQARRTSALLQRSFRM